MLRLVLLTYHNSDLKVPWTVILWSTYSIDWNYLHSHFETMFFPGILKSIYYSWQWVHFHCLDKVILMEYARKNKDLSFAQKLILMLDRIWWYGINIQLPSTALRWLSSHSQRSCLQTLLSGWPLLSLLPPVYRRLHSICMWLMSKKKKSKSRSDWACVCQGLVAKQIHSKWVCWTMLSPVLLLIMWKMRCPDGGLIAKCWSVIFFGHALIPYVDWLLNNLSHTFWLPYERDCNFTE